MSGSRGGEEESNSWTEGEEVKERKEESGCLEQGQDAHPAPEQPI